jgi:hypothetical protein
VPFPDGEPAPSSSVESIAADPSPADPYPAAADDEAAGIEAPERARDSI